IAQPVDQCPAVEYDLEVFAGDGVADGCRQRLGLELVDQSGKGFLETGMGRGAGRFNCAVRLSKPARAFCQFSATVYVVGKTESRMTLRMPSGWSRMRVCAR